MNFNDYFEKQGSIYLQNIDYRIITLESEPKNIKTESYDYIEVEIIEEGTQLRVLFTRNIKHNPEALFELDVTFGAIYFFKEKYVGDKSVEEINFKEILQQNKNTLFLNIVSRTSQLISQITSSHGRYPLITPPMYFEKK